MNDDKNGWGDSTVSTKYIYQYLNDVLDLGGDQKLQNASAQEQLDYICQEVSDLTTSLHRAFVSDTGKTVVEHEKEIEAERSLDDE